MLNESSSLFFLMVGRSRRRLELDCVLAIDLLSLGEYLNSYGIRSNILLSCIIILVSCHCSGNLGPLSPSLDKLLMSVIAGR